MEIDVCSTAQYSTGQNSTQEDAVVKGSGREYIEHARMYCNTHTVHPSMLTKGALQKGHQRKGPLTRELTATMIMAQSTACSTAPGQAAKHILNFRTVLYCTLLYSSVVYIPVLYCTVLSIRW